MDDASSVRVAALIQELVRGHAAAVPPPRALPYLGLEHASGTGLHLLDGLSAHGIFRKYELVLDLGAGLGGTSRWLAARLGCEVVCTTRSHAEAAAGAGLTRRARLATQVRFVPAGPGALPFRDGRFTHVWALETLARVADAAVALAEAHRALRRGGTLAVQELVGASEASVTIPGWRCVTADALTRALRDAGFVDIELRDRSADAPERSAQVLAARARLLEQLDAEAALAALARERRTLAAALAGGSLRVLQVVARRA